MAVPGVGVSLTTFGDVGALGAGGVARAARHVEALGLDGVWVPDVVMGDGSPGLDPVVVAAAAAGATERVAVGLGVLALPQRPVAALAEQLLTLQHVSGARLRLGVGTGGFAGTPFWRASGRPGDRPGARTDDVLRALPRLLRGEPVPVGEVPEVTLAPAVPVPPILVGGNGPAAVRRAVAYADGWFPSNLDPAGLAAARDRLHAAAAAADRQPPRLVYGAHAVLVDDQEAREQYVGAMRSMLGLAPDAAAGLLLTGGADRLADQLAGYAAAGAGDLVVTLDGARWEEQAEILADARSRLA